MGLKAWWERLLRLVYPEEKCICCGRDLEERGICPDCESELYYPEGNRCVRCSRPIPGEGDYCYSCEQMTYTYDSMRAVTVYDGSMRRMMLRYKEYNKARLGEYFASLLVDEVRSTEADVIAYVPSGSAIEGVRGFSHVGVIADLVSAETGIPVVDVLHRSGKAKQSRRSAKERIKEIKREYTLTDREPVKGKRVVLIDDIYTTGSTVEVCTKLLKRGGATRVDVRTVAIAVWDRQKRDASRP